MALGDPVAFRIADVYLPGVAEALLELNEHAMLIGRLIGFSDSGDNPKAFGVVEMEGGPKVIVPADKLRICEFREGPVTEERI